MEAEAPIMFKGYEAVRVFATICEEQVTSEPTVLRI